MESSLAIVNARASYDSPYSLSIEDSSLKIDWHARVEGHWKLNVDATWLHSLGKGGLG